MYVSINDDIHDGAVIRREVHLRSCHGEIGVDVTNVTSIDVMEGTGGDIM